LKSLFWIFLFGWAVHLGWFQLHPGLLLEDPQWPWRTSLLALTVLGLLPLLLVTWKLRTQPKMPLWVGMMALLWAMGIPESGAPNLAACLFVVPWLWPKPGWLACLALLWLQPEAGVAWLWARLGQRLPLLLVFPALALVLHHTLDPLALAVASAAWWLLRSQSAGPLAGAQLALLLAGGEGVPWHWLLLALALAGKVSRLAWIGLGLTFFAGWENSLNRSVIIPLQECRLGIGALFVPASQEKWARTAGLRFGLYPEDLELAEWLKSQPKDQKILVHTRAPQPRLQPRWVNLYLQRLSGRPDLTFFGPGQESWLSQWLSRQSDDSAAQLDKVVLRGPGSDKNWRVVDNVPAPLGPAQGKLHWQPEQPIGPGSFVEARVEGAPVGVSDGSLQATLPVGLQRIQLPVSSGQVRVLQGDKVVAEHSLDLDLALKNLRLLGFGVHPELASNSLLQVPMQLRLEGQQSLWVANVGVQLSRPDLPPGWRQGSPVTRVDQLLKPGQEVSLDIWIDTPEAGSAFRCDVYWLAPQRREYLLGSWVFTCFQRFPPRS